MQTMRRLKPFNGTWCNGDAQLALPFETMEEIYSYADTLSLCVLAMTCKQALRLRPAEEEMEMALQLRAKERLFYRLNAHANGLAEALTSVLEEGSVYMTGEFLSNCLIQSFNVDTVDIIAKVPTRNGRAMHSLFVAVKLLEKIYNAMDTQELDYSMEGEDQPSEELRNMGVLRCYQTMVCDLNIRVLVLNSYDSSTERDMPIQSMLKRVYRFSPFECYYDGQSFCANEMKDRMKKIGKTRNKLLENKLRSFENDYGDCEGLPEDYSLEKMKEKNDCMIRQARTSLSVVSNRYKELGYHIEEK